ncbi:transcriptional regulator BetI [uncultured Roseicyclus sp.]|jgi:TetR/AcrR family transcriptional regulator, transcriptional repressor of bet genes|uniref:choline-binding transcriptional repressor BetI n=1 Tax=uncultured Roseicyclus sp. TaxID=543072 RepID=UPI00262478DB|nr:transcriptional regulator BetI [uncultured Roseicyclus sp.]
MPRTGMMALRKDALVNAAIGVIGRKGSLDVTMGQIARAAGVSSALAHHYFGSKDDLFLAAMRAILSDFGLEARRELTAARTPRARLTALVRASFGGHNFQPDVIAAWLNFYVLAQTQPQAARLLRVYQQRLVSNLIHALRPLCPDPVAIAATTAALIDGLYIRHALTEAGPPDAGAATATVERYLDLATKGPR